ncbi:conserved hypothetical protein [Agrobacterium fabacearum TT111]|nr:conserved hypothetical protein [Agrobacterium fabacearum TT111]
MRAMLSDYDFSLMHNVQKCREVAFALMRRVARNVPFFLTRTPNLLIASREEGASPCAGMLQT